MGLQSDRIPCRECHCSTSEGGAARNPIDLPNVTGFGAGQPFYAFTILDRQFEIISPAVTTTRITTVVPVTVATCRQPSAAIAGSEVPRPKALIAISSPQVEASISGALISANAGATLPIEIAMLLMTHSATNTSAKTGNGMRAASLATERRANMKPMTRTTGNRRKTRNSFTTTAVLPTVSDTA